MKPVSIHWFRRDLRLDDNTALNNALDHSEKVLPIFIFDSEIIDEIPKNDHRVNFIVEQIHSLNKRLNSKGTSVQCFYGRPIQIWKKILSKYNVKTVFFNRDYEPYARLRDAEIWNLLIQRGVQLKTSKDHVIFEMNEVLKSDGKPYTVFTPYKKSWLKVFSEISFSKKEPNENWFPNDSNLDEVVECIGIQPSSIPFPKWSIEGIENYKSDRDFPVKKMSSGLSTHLRFGTVSVRQIIDEVKDNEVFLSELIWREFFQQIIYHFPGVVTQNFKPKYDGIQWRNDPEEIEKWKRGETGYPIVDAGMRELNQTGLMHNRVRMIVASFLVKHLLVDWRIGESYFAEKLFDFELASNNGNWQWVAGTGCDSAPYFRVFNPFSQQEKFDKGLEYIRKWVPEYQEGNYLPLLVEHKFARERAINTYKKGIS